MLAAPDSPWVRMHANLYTVGKKSKKGHKSCDPDNEEWELFLPAVQFSFNTAICSATNSSPLFLTYLCDPNLPYFQIYGEGSKLLGEISAANRFDCMKKKYMLTQQGITAAAAHKTQY